MELVNQFGVLIEEHKGDAHMGLMMFVVADDDPAIRSTAAMSLAVQFPPKNGDDLTGPKFVVNTLLTQEKDPERQGDALAGILLLGDKRLLPLLCDAWKKLPDEGRIALSQARSGLVTEAMVEFWLRCLETGCSERVFGSVVAAIGNMPAVASVPVVQDVERVFPVYRDSENPITRLRQTPFSDYLEVIRPRLEALEAAESEPKIIPKIYENWSNAEQVRAAVHTDAPLLFRKVEAALPNFTPTRVAPDFLGQCEPTGLFAYGIFNPMGPTICTVSLLRHERANTSLIHYQMLNPFAQERMVIGALVNEASNAEFVALLARTFADNNINEHPLILSLPTFLMVSEKGNDSRALAFACLRSHVTENGRLSEIVERLVSLKRYKGRPWDRAKSERARAMESFAAQQPPSKVSGSRAVADEKEGLKALEEWLELLTSPNHLQAELRSFVQAWQGSIDFQHDNFLGKEAMPLEQMLNSVMESNPECVVQIGKAIQS
jgi:hypothetical protein